MTYNLTTDEFDAIADVVVWEDVGEMYPGYSGRGMYGDRCLGITGDSWQIARAMDKVIRTLRDMGHDDLADFLDNTSPCADSLGMRAICYWPMLRTDDELIEYAEKEWS